MRPKGSSTVWRHLLNGVLRQRALDAREPEVGDLVEMRPARSFPTGARAVRAVLAVLARAPSGLCCRASCRGSRPGSHGRRSSPAWPRSPSGVAGPLVDGRWRRLGCVRGSLGGRGRKAPRNDSQRLKTTQSDSERLRTTQNDSERLRAPEASAAIPHLGSTPPRPPGGPSRAPWGGFSTSTRTSGRALLYAGGHLERRCPKTRETASPVRRATPGLGASGTRTCHGACSLRLAEKCGSEEPKPKRRAPGLFHLWGVSTKRTHREEKPVVTRRVSTTRRTVRVPVRVTRRVTITVKPKR